MVDLFPIACFFAIALLTEMFRKRYELYICFNNGQVYCVKYVHVWVCLNETGTLSENRYLC